MLWGAERLLPTAKGSLGFHTGGRPYQPIIVSGLAYGIDVYAHKLAMACGLTTVGVVAGGLTGSIHVLICRRSADDCLGAVC